MANQPVLVEERTREETEMGLFGGADVIVLPEVTLEAALAEEVRLAPQPEAASSIQK